jgi:hypothetical protein
MSSPSPQRAGAVFIMSELSTQNYVRTITNVYASAQAWLSRPEGFKVLPIQPNSKRLLRGYGPSVRQIEFEEDVRFWFERRGANLAVMAPSSVKILDFDRIEFYESWAAAWPDLAKSYSEITPRGGRHVWLSLPGGGSLVVPGLVKGVELKRFCLVSPSQINGVRYEIVEPGSIRAVSVETVRRALEPFFTQGDKYPTEPTKRLCDLPRGSQRKKYGLIDRVKAAWPILTYMTYFEPNLKITGVGEWRECLCPWHADHTPSMRINIVTNSWRCFACEKFGDVINWHALRLGVREMGEAARDLDLYKVKVGM